MKKVISIILTMSLILGLCASVAYSNSVTVKHRVTPISKFSLDGVSITAVTDSNSRTFANLHLENNTRDGYNLSVKSDNGVLAPASSADGEQDIVYSCSVLKESGESGIALENLTSFVPAQSTAGTDIFDGSAIDIGNTASLLNTPTNIDLVAGIAVSDISFINMAGSYSEKFTFTYTDQ